MINMINEPVVPSSGDLSSHVVRALQELEEYEDFVMDKSLANEPLDGSRVAVVVHKVARILKDGMQLAAVGKDVKI